jgi:hypothetical protein
MIAAIYAAKTSPACTATDYQEEGRDGREEDTAAPRH